MHGFYHQGLTRARLLGSTKVQLENIRGTVRRTLQDPTGNTGAKAAGPGASLQILAEDQDRSDRQEEQAA